MEPSKLRAMVDSLAHRGPDGWGDAWIRDEHTATMGWMGHRRLKVIDLSARADQPMASPDGRLVISYNGEIYNFRELRSQLEGLGYSFRSHGDTEVALRAYEAWGLDAIPRLDGMFAIALWDGAQGRLVLARDRTGKKPLFYAGTDERIAFGSEIKAVLLCPWVERGPDLSRVAEYLTFGWVTWPHTLYEGVQQVPPASVVVFDRDGLHAPQPYWTPIPDGTSLKSTADVRRQIRTLLEDGVRRRLVADVPVGVLLSGGIDSSLVVSLMAANHDDSIHTFSIGFSDDYSYDERPYAALVARHFGTRHTEFVVHMDAVALLDRLIWHHDGPFGDSSAIPTYAVCNVARQHVTVALNGDGGDEVFAGYDRFRAAALAERVPAWLVDIARIGSRCLPTHHGYYSLRRRIERFSELAHSPIEDRYLSWVAIANPALLGDLIQPELLRIADPLSATVAAHDEVSHLPVLDRLLYINLRTYLPDDLAVKMDRMSMAHSLETRSPFLDTELLEYLTRIQASEKTGLYRVKPLLRAACRDLLPDSIWNRRKHGFGAPVGAWFRAELGEVFADEVLGRDARSVSLIRTSTARRLWNEHRAGKREHGSRLWALLTLERWLRTFDQPVRVVPPNGAGVVDATRLDAPSRSVA